MNTDKLKAAIVCLREAGTLSSETSDFNIRHNAHMRELANTALAEVEALAARIPVNSCAKRKVSACPHSGTRPGPPDGCAAFRERP